MLHSSLDLVLILLATTVFAVACFSIMKLPPVLAYLLVGAGLGPHGAALVPDSEQARYLAEFGVVFLMFSIGLEFSLPRLFAMKRLVFGLGGLQVTVTIVVLCALGLLFGMRAGESFAAAAALAMSSTAILSKLLADRLELDASHGRQVIGVLLFQDVAVVPLLILLPALSQPPETLAVTLLLAALKAAVVLAVLLFFGQKFMRRWFHIVARRQSSELFMLNVLLITLGLAWITERAGLSMPLGAFLAGMLISETEYRIEVEESIKPFRDILLGFFMVTVGMFLDVQVILNNAFAVLGLLLVFVAIKFVIVFGASKFIERTTGTAVRTGLWLCAGGEFGFVLLTQANDLKLIAHAFLQIVVAALVLSMLFAPLIVQASEKIVMRFVASEWMLRAMELTRVASRTIATEQHVLVCGFGRSGQYLVRILEQENISYVALDLDPDRVREAAAGGDSVVYGDCSRRETLVAAGLSRAKAVVISFNDLHSSLKVIHHIQALRPDLPIVVRAADERNMERLVAAGAAEVVPEMLETGISLASHTLAFVGVPLLRVQRRIRDVRDQRYGLMKGFYPSAMDSIEDYSDLPRLHSLTLVPGSYAIGRSIEELDLASTGTQVYVVRRRGIRVTEPSPETRFIDADVVVLMGTPTDLGVAEIRLLQGE